MNKHLVSFDQELLQNYKESWQNNNRLPSFSLFGFADPN
jgi:hypothetical protein